MTSPPGKTIRLFLVDDSPSGLIVAEILYTWTGLVLSFPRTLLPQVLKTRPEINKTGVYFLVGPNPDNPYQPLVYVGESDNLTERLAKHDKERDFFEQVAIIVSKDENLTKAHVRYIESRLIETIKRVGEASLENANAGQPVSLPECDRAGMEGFLHQIQTLLPVLGYRFLQEIPNRKITLINTSASNEPSFSEGPSTAAFFELAYLGGKVQAEAYEMNGQFVVMAGAVCRNPKQATQSMKGNSQLWTELKTSLKNGILVEDLTLDIELVRLTTDKSFTSPSRAASFVCANPVSGPITWKVKNTGQTYKEWREAQLK
jgi:hypothetical protein